ncbi:hypothetical protein AVEN_187297-1 [Araneus ventricosus]|uniref:RNase H type-1 domain-containing protein n=1 Tax=Araneus ventricosus TaxID=182803 RepID=A0A4Y2SAU5_ARAVE|nr:hypothetical protein AVEN_246810-1 [Araneus ventricosus]GBN85196.1 hypothetical protein AVEN_187297-1 [Araneus ventricosus]
MLNTSAPTHISVPHTSSIIDLTLCSASIYNEIDCYVSDCTFESDHIPIVISWSKFQNTTHSIKTIIWKPIITKSIEIFNTTSQPNIDLIQDQISRTISAHTSNKILDDKDYPPWWNAACHNFSHLKKLACNKARRNIAITEWIKYKKYRKTQLKACNVIQNTSLRIALGVPIWTPNVILLKLAGQEILSGKIKRLAIQFFIIKSRLNPFLHYSIPLIEFTHNWSKKMQSLRITFRNLNCIPDHIISLPIFPHSNPNVWEIFLKDFYFQNKELPSSIISSDFIECIQRFFPNHFIIATDGSKSHCHTSIAGFSCLQQFCYRIHHLNSVFTAEVLAICQALDELVIPEKDILILSDSFSALSSLKNLSFHSPKVIQRLAAKIHIRKNLNKKIALLWVPGHSGVSWNEKADSIAKQVSDFSPHIDWIASEEILSHLKKQITEENYHKSKYQLLIGNIPTILTISNWTGNRVQDRLIARIISKTIATPGLLSRFNLHPDPLCRVCNEINDISHILLRCQKYASVRVIL